MAINSTRIPLEFQVLVFYFNHLQSLCDTKNSIFFKVLSYSSLNLSLPTHDFYSSCAIKLPVNVALSVFYCLS